MDTFYKKLRKIEKEITMECVTNNDGSIIVPNGYLYCDDCRSLTPHDKNEYGWPICLICSNTKFSSELCPHCGWEHDSNDLNPDVIYHTIHNDGCHFNEIEIKSNYNDEISMTYNIADDIFNEFKDNIQDMLHRKYPNVIFYNGCEHHGPNTKKESEDIRRWRKRLNEMRKMKCGCPRIPIFPVGIKIRNYTSHPIYSMDCVNAYEWSYDVLCPICGTWFECGDSNC